MEYKVGQRILNVNPDSTSRKNEGKYGTITSICGEVVCVDYDDGESGSSSNPSKYYKIIGENPINKIMLNIKEFVKNSLLSADEKALREVGFKDSCGNYTSEAKDFVLNAITEERKADLVEVAVAMIAEAKSKK